MRIGTVTTISLLALTVAACGAAPYAASAPESAAYATDEADHSMADHGMAPSPGGAPLSESPAPSQPPPAAPSRESGADHEEPLSARVATGAKPAPSPVLVAQPRGVKAGEWDDNANYREFVRFLGTQQGAGYDALDVRERQFLVVRDSAGKGVPNCSVSVSDSRQRSVHLKTMASGRAILFPHAEGLAGRELVATTNCQGGLATARVSLDQVDGVVDLQLARQRALPARPTIDVAFVLDTTGSMSEEIAAVKDTIREVAASLEGLGADVRVGLVEFKDRTDSFVTRVYPMSTDLDAFSRTIDRLVASGGGDTPESVNEGLSVAANQLSWNAGAVARLAFLIGDAPPHLDYPQDTSYVATARYAAQQGIQFYTIAASGMDDLGQVVWRQVAQYTGGTNMFVLRGGAGPQSTGGGDPTSSCGGTQTNYASGNLDQLIVRKIQRAIKDLERDPTRIAGLGVDERAKPCDQRLVIAE